MRGRRCDSKTGATKLQQNATPPDDARCPSVSPPHGPIVPIFRLNQNITDRQNITDQNRVVLAECQCQQVMCARAGRADRAFGIGLVRWIMEERPELFDLALACKPRVMSLFLNIIEFF
jgi:hypothetical protein